MAVSDPGDRLGVLERERLAHRMGVRVLQLYQAGDGLVQVTRVAKGAVEFVQVESAVRALLHLPN